MPRAIPVKDNSLDVEWTSMTGLLGTESPLLSDFDKETRVGGMLMLLGDALSRLRAELDSWRNQLGHIKGDTGLTQAGIQARIRTSGAWGQGLATTTRESVDRIVAATGNDFADIIAEAIALADEIRASMKTNVVTDRTERLIQAARIDRELDRLLENDALTNDAILTRAVEVGDAVTAFAFFDAPRRFLDNETLVSTGVLIQARETWDAKGSPENAREARALNEGAERVRSARDGLIGMVDSETGRVPEAAILGTAS